MTVRMPGPTVASQQPRTDFKVTNAKRIIGTLGGMSCPRIEEQLTSAVEWPLEYPCSTIFAIIILPMAATPAEHVPAMAPNIAHDTTVTAPRRTISSMSLIVQGRTSVP